MKAIVRRIGTKVCYTFPNGKFVMAESEECGDDLRRAATAPDNEIEVTDLLYLIAV